MAKTTGEPGPVGRLDGEAATLEQAGQMLGVALHVGVGAGDVRDRDELHQFVDDLALVLGAPGGDW